MFESGKWYQFSQQDPDGISTQAWQVAEWTPPLLKLQNDFTKQELILNTNSVGFLSAEPMKDDDKTEPHEMEIMGVKMRSITASDDDFD